MLILLFFIPMLAREAQVIANINYDDLSVNLGHLLNNVQNFLYSNGLIGEHETLVGIITTELKEFANLATFSNMLGGFLSATGSFFFGLFAVLFLTFFFIKDDFRLEGVAILLFGKRHAIRLTIVSNKINNLLSRYFIGLLTEIAAMIVLLYIGLALFGIKGALLFAVFGGMLNAIPYLGPIIGAVTCCVFGIVNCISINEYFDILPTILKIAGTFIGANLIDNAILQPYIYSHSVKAHPAEIFLVIIMGGSLAGILGMLFAIPVYTIIRTIVVELFNYMNGK
jgi:predicted PurR-regulated permease PerM